MRRRLDPGLTALHEAGAMNGHVPITAIVSLIAVVGAFIYGYDTVAMAVERSASEETMWVDGEPGQPPVLEEQGVRAAAGRRGGVDRCAGADLRIGPAPVLRAGHRPGLRRAGPLSRGRSAAVTRPFDSRPGPDDRWCGRCPKCRFVGLMLAPFLAPAELTAIIGTDMFADPTQVEGFAALMSDVDKPFECVGERRESAAALRLLAGRPGWRDSVVVTALAPVAGALVGAEDVEGLLSARPELAFPDPDVAVGRRRPDGGSTVSPGPLTLDEALARRVAVWGMGAEGLALARLAVDRGVDTLLIDDHPEESAGRVQAALRADRPVRSPGDVDWSSVDVVVRSPGVSRYRAELAAAESDGVTVTTAMALWLEDHADAQVLAITGTKGKSTTAALAAAVLEADGRTVELIGNIGVPVVDTYGRPRPDAYVVEVSSYQAADVTRTPRVVVLTSLAPDHLDWHGGVEAYYRDKLRLVEAGPPGRLAVSAGNEEALARTEGHPDRTLFGPDGRVRVGRDGRIEVDGTSVIDANRLRVPGRHNAWNLCGAIAGILLLTDAAPSTPARRVGRRHLHRTAVALSRAGRTRRPDLRGRRSGFEPVRRGDVGRVIRRSSADRHRRRSGPGCRCGAPGGRAGRPPTHGRGGGPPSRPGTTRVGARPGGHRGAHGGRPGRGGPDSRRPHPTGWCGPLLTRGADPGGRRRLRGTESLVHRGGGSRCRMTSRSRALLSAWVDSSQLSGNGG